MLSTVLIWCASAWAGSITVEFGYRPPSDRTVAGFRLYRDGKPVCSTTDPAARTLHCDSVDTGAQAAYTLTALFADGAESPHSAPCRFPAPAGLPADPPVDPPADPPRPEIGLPIIQSATLEALP
jgi:hypothetical protein